MTETTFPAGGATPAVELMRRELADLHKEVRDLRSLQSSGRLWVWGSTALIILMFAVFMYATYHRIRGNFGQPAMQKAISEHGAELMPMTQQLLTQAGANVMPAYRDAVVATLKTRGPVAATSAVDQFRKLPEESGKEFQDKIKTAFDAAVAKIEPEFKAAYPNVTDEKRQQIMAAFVADEITAQNKRIATRVDQLYTNDLIHMQGVLEKYDVPATVAAGDQQGLEKQFLHTMVALLDDQVEAAYPTPATGPAEVASLRVAPSTRPTTAP